MKRIILLIGLIYTQSIADLSLTLKSTIDLSLKQGIDAQKSLNQVKQSSMTLQSSKATFYPQMNTSFSTNANQRLQNSDYNLSYSSNASVGLSYSFQPSSIPQYKASKQELAAAEMSHKQMIGTITHSSVVSYVKTVFALSAIKAEQKNCDYQKEKLKEIEAFKDAGRKSIADVLQQQTAIAEAESRLLETQQTYEKMVLSLLDATGQPLDSKCSIDTTDIGILISSINSSDTSFASAARELPGITAQKNMIGAARNTLKSSQWAYFPSISGSLGSGYGFDNEIPDLNASVSINFPILDQSRRKLNLQRNALNLQAEELNLKELKRDESLKTTQAKYDFAMARKKVDAAQVRLNAAQQTLDAVNQRYASGASTLVEVAMVNTSYLNAVNSKLQAESSMLIGYLDLIFQNGNINEFVNNLFAEKKQ